MTLPKRKPRKRMNVRQSDRVRSRAHLQWVRGHECAVAGALCSGKTEAAHVRGGTDGGMGMKPGDNWVIPLCQDHHRGQHAVGEAAFEKAHGIDMKATAMGLWQRSPHRIRWEKEQDNG